jgi:hypothetical protein
LRNPRISTGGGRAAEGGGARRYKHSPDVRNCACSCIFSGKNKAHSKHQCESGESSKEQREWSSVAFFGKNKAQRQQHSKTNAAGLQQQHLRVHVCNCCIVCFAVCDYPACVFLTHASSKAAA